MVSKAEKSAIRSLIQSPAWRFVEQVAVEVQAKIASENGSQESEWDVVKSTLLKQGQIEGIARFIQEILSQAQEEE